MNAILGFGQILQMDELDQGQTEAVGQIMKAGRHLLALINEVLDISRIECGKMTMSIEPMQVGLLVQEAAAMLGPLAESRGIQINVQLAHSEGQHVHADRKRLTQCLINLLSNAVKYNRDGGFVDVICQVEGDEWTALICDSGPGIPEAMQGRLFTPFDRLGAETSETEGTGLGLTVAQRLIVEMGGKLWLNSTNSNGSAFALRLPTSAPVTLPSADSDMIETSFAPQRSKRVLYIEDNNSNLALIQRLFARVPAIELIAAPNGLTGIRLADEKNPDLILLDLHLPDMEGQEVLTRLLAAGKDSNANIVILSADASPGQIERLLARGAKAYITKPIDVGEFWSIVGSLLGSENLRAA
jgi:CheY-like chemotaxis protein/two-component sensor histidine kinase